MILNIQYIKNILNTEANDESIQYLINHFFEYMLDYLNIDTTMEIEEIDPSIPESDEYIKNSTIEENEIIEDFIPEENEIQIQSLNIEYQDLTIFQKTLVCSIACAIQKMNILIEPINNEIYTQALQIIELTEEEKNNITYCLLSKKYLEYLYNSLNSSSTVGYLRRLLDLEPTDISDDEIEFLIEHYTNYYKDIIPNVDSDSVLFKEAVYLAVACHIFRTNPTIIISPTSYTIDEVREEFGVTFDKDKNTWCDLADAALTDLKRKTIGLYGVTVWDRPGARSTGNYYGKYR